MTTKRHAFKPEGFDPKPQLGSRTESSILPAVLASVFLLMPLSVVAQETVKAEESSATVRLAVELLNEKEYKKAAGICHDATGLTAEDSEICLLVRAISYNNTGNYRQAIYASRQLANSTKNPISMASAFRELGVGFTNRLKNKGRWSVKKVSTKFLSRLREAEMAFRKSLDMNRDETGLVQIALMDVLVAEMIYGKEWEHDEEIKELAKFFLARNPSGRRADWAREVACLSDRYHENDEEPAPSLGNLVKEDTLPVYVSEEVTAPEKISAPAPTYPVQARRARVQGTVIVQVVVDATGNVNILEVLKGLPLCLSEEAVLTMKKWKFKPALLNGKAVAVYYKLTVKFGLQ